MFSCPATGPFRLQPSQPPCHTLASFLLLHLGLRHLSFPTPQIQRDLTSVLRVTVPLSISAQTKTRAHRRGRRRVQTALPGRRGGCSPPAVCHTGGSFSTFPVPSVGTGEVHRRKHLPESSDAPCSSPGAWHGPASERGRQDSPGPQRSSRYLRLARVSRGSGALPCTCLPRARPVGCPETSTLPCVQGEL